MRERGSPDSTFQVKIAPVCGRSRSTRISAGGQVAELMGVTPGRISQIENGDLDVNEVATLSRYAQALGARMRIIFDYGNDMRQIA